MIEEQVNNLDADKKFKNLVGKTDYVSTPDRSILEVFKAPTQKRFRVEFETAVNEFTSLCPITGQPDFATFRISYTPKDLCVESKSLKIYLFSYRNTQGFGETITNKIADDLFEVLRPDLLEVCGTFSPRGGLKWTTFAYRS